jgi:hypothetical protein
MPCGRFAFKAPYNFSQEALGVNEMSVGKARRWSGLASPTPWCGPWGDPIADTQNLGGFTGRGVATGQIPPR